MNTSIYGTDLLNKMKGSDLSWQALVIQMKMTFSLEIWSLNHHMMVNVPKMAVVIRFSIVIIICMHIYECLLQKICYISLLAVPVCTVVLVIYSCFVHYLIVYRSSHSSEVNTVLG